MNTPLSKQEKLQKLHILLKDLCYMQNNLLEIIEKIKSNAELDENFMKLYTIEFNDAIYDINLFYRYILDLCIELYWSNQSYISTPKYNNISWE